MEFGRYRILSQLGQGGMATVYLGEDPSLNRLVAIKVIQSHLNSNVNLIDRFTVEAKTIAALRHVNIVEVFDFGFHQDQQYLVMEYIDGQSLQMICTAMAGKPMPDTIAAAIICQSAEGLTSAEKHGVVHRDIKPENLLFNSEGILKIADFGIAHIADEQSRTQTGAVLGSPNFMSPEQIEGLKPTHKTDLFSLGGVFYYCLTGKLPFTGPSIPVTMRNICDRPHPSILESNPVADPFLIKVVDTLLQKDPTLRGEAGARWLSNQLRGWLNRHDVVDIVEHVRQFISGLGLQGHAMVEAIPTSSRSLRPDTKAEPAMRSGGASNSQLHTGFTPSSTILNNSNGGMSTHPTTGALGPSSRSPLVWVGVLLTVSVLVLASAVYFSSGKNDESNLKTTVVKSNPQPKPKIVTQPPKEVPQDPLTSEPVVREVVSDESNNVGMQNPDPKINRPTPKPEFKPKTPRPIPRPITPPRPEPMIAPARTGFVLIRSAPPFAALTINGRPQGETPMSSWLEVPVGKCHVEIVHRLTPPFDTVLTVSPGSKHEFKFKLER